MPMKGEALVVESPDIGVYAEIGDVKSSFSYTQNAVYGASGTHEPPPGDASSNHVYEDAKLAQQEAEECSDPYRVRKCSAYGAVSLEVDGSVSVRMDDTSPPLKMKDMGPLKMN